MFEPISSTVHAMRGRAGVPVTADADGLVGGALIVAVIVALGLWLGWRRR